MRKWIYYGLFLDTVSRYKLQMFLENSKYSHLYNKLSRVILSHCTLLHKRQYDKSSFVDNLIKTRLDTYLEDNNTSIRLLVTHIGMSEKTMAFRVSLNKEAHMDLPSIYTLCANDIPHITIGTYKGGKPVDSNKITYWCKLEEPILIETILKRV